ncbi:hypothetical protein EJV47_10215 [Hymenobacter gummosus]|uniref:Copper chaperone n=1 Tax=Hymenobacter gummosus TaxID=1776032 RepID=A0A431U359_9BACT|nr:hypothetical protein [Hymenobacter gummosus]RTQ50008.1 hypothetical protein EJV47_10215 [Hymenobacter gummosus]
MSDFAANNNQLVRYQLTIPAMTAPDALAATRSLLQQQGLVVDRIEPGEAVVASATGTEPDWENLKGVLQTAGYPITHSTTLDEGEEAQR